MIRRFIHKSKAISEVSQAVIEYVSNWMNTLPRRLLKYSTPKEELIKEFLNLNIPTALISVLEKGVAFNIAI